MGLSVDQQVKRILDGVDEFLPTEGDLRARIESKGTLRVKLGLDPTHTDLTIGHAVVLQKLRDFQDLGHTAVLIIGDFTALVGDPSGRSKSRPQLTEADIAGFAKTFADQAGHILDMDKVEIRYNSEWLAKLSMRETIELTQKITVARMLERQDFSTRYKGEIPIYVHEFLYALLQGYDSVAVEADIELGGTEQKFNLLMGRQVMPDYGQEPQMVLTMPLLVGTDGVEKMSKSLGNYIALTETPRDMFGKVMSIPDNIIGNYFQLAVGRTAEEVEAMERAMAEGKNPMDFKLDLAEAITARFHSPVIAAAERTKFIAAFSDHDKEAIAEEVIVPEHLIARVPLPDAKQYTEDDLAFYAIINLGEGVEGVMLLDIVPAMVELGMVGTGNEARRLISQGAVKISGRRISPDDKLVPIKDGELLEVGKKKAYRVHLQ
ncbi:MAG: tyrosine--tRNA ligase [Phycisphaerae bacterium]|nr:tyrosine--tRNA ligase [Phycisphaerae bacterium]